MSGGITINQSHLNKFLGPSNSKRLVKKKTSCVTSE